MLVWVDSTNVLFTHLGLNKLLQCSLRQWMGHSKASLQHQTALPYVSMSARHALVGTMTSSDANGGIPLSICLPPGAESP